MNKKYLAIGIAAVLALLVAVYLLTGITASDKLSFSDVLTKARNGEIKTITTNSSNRNITLVLYKDNKSFTSTIPSGRQKLDDMLVNAGVPDDKWPDIQDDTNAMSSGPMRSLLLTIGILLLIGSVLYWIRRRRDGGQNNDMTGGPFQMGRSNARLVTPQKAGVTFEDVAGADEAKQELQEVVEFLKSPDKFAALGARIPKGVLLVGSPGTGKTLIAKAVAGEANVPFLSVSGSEFVEMYVGVGASRVRNLFMRAKKMAPCIIFIDEVDALGRKRGGMKSGGGTEEREQTLNQMLVEMDGFDSSTNIIIIAATNRPDVLDPALLRPGRFDRQVMIDNPDYRGRSAILRVHAKGKPFAPEVDLDRIARQTPGFSGADLMNLCNEAAILTARRNKKAITLDELEEAIDRVLAGPERKSRLVSERERLTVAYHEVGHALVAKLAGTVDPVQKISIISRGRMGGYTRVGAGEDRTLWSKTQLEDYMAFALGGAAAEELTFGEVTTGPSNDIERATEIARAMVCDYGMTEKFGPLALGSKQGGEFLGGGQRSVTYSPQVAYQIDQEVHALVQKALGRAKDILTRYNLHLIAVSEAVLEKEVISGDDMNEIFDRVEREGMGVNMFALRPFSENSLGLHPDTGRLGKDTEGEKTAKELPGVSTETGLPTSTVASMMLGQEETDNMERNRTAI